MCSKSTVIIQVQPTWDQMGLNVTPELKWVETPNLDGPCVFPLRYMSHNKHKGDP